MDIIQCATPLPSYENAPKRGPGFDIRHTLFCPGGTRSKTKACTRPGGPEFAGPRLALVPCRCGSRRLPRPPRRAVPRVCGLLPRGPLPSTTSLEMERSEGIPVGSGEVGCSMGRCPCVGRGMSQGQPPRRPGVAVVHTRLLRQLAAHARARTETAWEAPGLWRWRWR